jgi:hypothetical protein
MLSRQIRRSTIPTDRSADTAACELTDGLPWLPAEVSDRWLGRRLFLWPDGVPDGRRLSVASSRMPASDVGRTTWFDLLRLTVLRCNPRQDVLCVVTGTAASAATARAAALFARRVLEFRSLAADGVSLSNVPVTAGSDAMLRRMLRWLQDALTKIEVAADEPEAAAFDDSSRRVMRAILSPQFDCPPDNSLQSLPLADRLLFAAADRVHVLALREGGHVQQLIAEHASDPDRVRAAVLVATDGDGCAARTLAEFRSLVAWVVDAFPGTREPRVATPDTGVCSSELLAPTDSASTPLTAPDDWLLHWTRAPHGPWPGESADDVLDEQILGWKPADRSALATLWRIVADGRLKASREGIRGRFAVVSLTEVPLSEFRSRRVFRPHRNRSDFEPWGVAIRREAITRLGGRPVVYGSEPVWKRLPDHDRPWFQRFEPGHGLDTRREREWRVTGDIDLRALPGDSCCLFVDSEDAAEALRRHSPWPVVVVPAPR